MTMREAGERYRIPLAILREYESWGLGGAEAKDVCDDADLERLSLLMTLYDIGFSPEEARTYMGLLLEETHTEDRRLRMLEEKRRAILDEIHGKERRLQRLDHLRHELQKALRR